jgi:predicted GNAT family acetyltransferase
MNVEHLPEQHRFQIQLPEGSAVLDYRMHEPQVMELTHTFVPSTARGKGLAAMLVQGGLDYARANNFRVIPSCWYAEKFLSAHPEYQDLLSGDVGVVPPRSAPVCEI